MYKLKTTWKQINAFYLIKQMANYFVYISSRQQHLNCINFLLFSPHPGGGMLFFSLSDYYLNEAMLNKMNFNKNEGVEKRYWIRLKTVLGFVQQSCNWGCFCTTKHYILK